MPGFIDFIQNALENVAADSTDMLARLPDGNAGAPSRDEAAVNAASRDDAVANGLQVGVLQVWVRQVCDRIFNLGAGGLPRTGYRRTYPI